MRCHKKETSFHHSPHLIKTLTCRKYSSVHDKSFSLNTAVTKKILNPAPFLVFQYVVRKRGRRIPREGFEIFNLILPNQTCLADLVLLSNVSSHVCVSLQSEQLPVHLDREVFQMFILQILRCLVSFS